MLAPSTCLVLAAALQALAGENLLENGAVDGPRGWSHTGGGAVAELELDRELGAAAPGSLRIHYPGAPDGTPHNWRQTVPLPAARPRRLELSGMVRIEGAGPGSEACIMVQLLPAEGAPLGYGRCPEVRADADWTRVEAVFDVPPGAERVFLLAYFTGPGTCWFDDLRLVPTEREVTQPAPGAAGADPRLEELARGCAADLPWCFDAEQALARAGEESKPILAYVRCTDDREHLGSMLATIEGAEVRLQEDGYAKDLLFRAGPLSEPDVRALLERRFVPVCLTYVLGDHTYGGASPPGWSTTVGSARFEASVSEGDARPGCLSIANDDPEDRQPHNWHQALAPPAELPAVLELSASIKTEGFARGSEATVMIQCWKGQEALAYGRVQEVLEDGDWRRQTAKFSVPEGTDTIRVLAYLVGPGRAWFDDISIRSKERPDEDLVQNGGLDRLDSGGLGGFALSPRELTTPALVVLSSEGEPLRKLHRFGALSSELVDRFLRGSLAELGASSASEGARELYLDGELARALEATAGAKDDAARLLRARALLRSGELADAERALAGLAGPAAELARGRLAMRRGEWAPARDAFDAAGELEEARFWGAFCRARLGEHAEALERWRALAGESVFGRRAAACLLAGGPRLPLALSERAWPRADELPEESELGRADGFEPQRSIRALIELRRPDGSFGGHMGLDGRGWADAAITALAADALRAWDRRAKGELRAAMRAAREDALAWLERWSAAPPPGSDAFNNPYALMTLVEEERGEAAARVIARIASSQLSDGNWTVYHAERPASFNTALNVMALARAAEARIDVPEDVLERGVVALAAMRQESGRFPYSTATGHEWMTTEHGSIARDPLCEHALLVCGEGDAKALAAALERYARFAHELRAPTKRLYDYFNSRGHGGYYFFFAHRNVVEAAPLAKSAVQKRALATARDAVLRAREGDGTFVDQFMLGRAYGTAMALLVLAAD